MTELTSPPGRRAKRRVPIAMLCLLASSAALAGPLQFEFSYSGVFSDGVDDSEQQRAVERAGSLFSDLFGGYFSNAATLQLEAFGASDPSNATLMSASTYLLRNPGFGRGEVVRNKLLSYGAMDLNGADADGFVNVNFGYNWMLDPDAAMVTPDRWDFYATFFHEITHALGFGATLSEAGADVFGVGNDGGTAGHWSTFDSHLTNCAGEALISPEKLTINAGTYDQAKSGGGSVCFDGAFARLGNDGHPVELYTPFDYLQGSSLKHVSQDAFASTVMMKWDRNPGADEARDYNTAELGILRDLGYGWVGAVSPVPEPATWMMMAAGLLGLVWTRRARPHV
jgi:hypothetical protein